MSMLWGTRILVLLVACMPSLQEEGSPAEKPESSADAVSREIERLRALGYIGVTEEPVDANLKGVVRLDLRRCWPGYTLYSNHARRNRRQNSAELIDISGKLINSWRDPENMLCANCELLPNGDLLLVGSKLERGSTDKEAVRSLVRLSWQNEVIWRKTIPVHHDVEVTPRGRTLTLTSDYKRAPRVNADVDIRDDRMVLLSPEGGFVQERSIYRALRSNPAEMTIQSVEPKSENGKTFIDLIHANSIESMYKEHLYRKHAIYRPGNVMICMRHQDTVAIINWKLNRLLWAWGQGEVSGPHDAHVLDNGNILLFDNGLGRNWSRVIELDPLSKQIVWEYRAPNPTDFYSRSRGACQRFPNGNTLITNSNIGQAFEVTAGGEIVWEYLNPNITRDGKRLTFARAKRYEISFVDDILKQNETEERK